MGSNCPSNRHCTGGLVVVVEAAEVCEIPVVELGNVCVVVVVVVVVVGNVCVVVVVVVVVVGNVCVVVVVVMVLGNVWVVVVVAVVVMEGVVVETIAVGDDGVESHTSAGNVGSVSNEQTPVFGLNTRS